VALKAALDAQTAAGSAADDTLQANIDSESATRRASDQALGASLASEEASRTAADSGLQQQITSNTTAISANANSIAAVETEIGDKANNYGNSRIDASSIASGEIVGVIWSGEGGHEDSSNFYRTLVLNQTTSELAVRGEIDHGLDYVANTGYWYCTIGDQIANGDIQRHVENLPDDHAELAAVGLGEHSAHWWSFRFEDTQGTNGTSPFARIQVRHPVTGEYFDVRPTEAYPVSGWIMGRRSADGKTPERAVRVGLSHSQLRALTLHDHDFTLGYADNDVLVDLNYSVAKLR
jgi:hypothetical protein